MSIDVLKATVLIFFAVVLQSAIVSSIDIAGGTPDLVLVTLVAISLLRGPLRAAEHASDERVHGERKDQVQEHAWDERADEDRARVDRVAEHDVQRERTG